MRASSQVCESALRHVSLQNVVDFIHQLLALEALFLHDQGHRFFQPVGFSFGQVFGADDDDGQVAGLGVGAQTVDHAEAVEARHDEVQQQDIGTTGLDSLQPGHAVERGIQPEFRFGQELAQHIRDIGIVIHHEDVFLPAEARRR